MNKQLILFLIFLGFAKCLAGQDTIPPSSDGDLMFFVEFRPIFPGCESIRDWEEQGKCTDQKLLSILKDSLVFPDSAYDIGTTGHVVLSFIIDKKGNLLQPEIKRGLDPACDQEAFRLFSLLPQPWTPAINRDHPVTYRFDLPIRFSWLDENARREAIAAANAPKPPLPIPITETDKVFFYADVPAVFLGCDGMDENIEKCSRSKIRDFFDANLQYPSTARQNRTEGLVILKIIVERDGRITGPEVTLDRGDGLGEEALRIVGLMPNWQPATISGKPVRFGTEVKMRFKL